MIWVFIRPDAVDALENPKVVSALPRYVGIVKGRRTAKFLISQATRAEFSEGAAVEELWEAHRKAISEESELVSSLDSGKFSLNDLPRPKKSLLKLKVLLGSKIMESCTLCERMCRKNRMNGELGYCGAGADMKVSSCFEHMGEEPEIIPSFTVYGSQKCRPS